MISTHPLTKANCRAADLQDLSTLRFGPNMARRGPLPANAASDGAQERDHQTLRPRWPVMGNTAELPARETQDTTKKPPWRLMP